MIKLLLILSVFFCCACFSQVVNGDGQVVFMVDDNDSIYFDYSLDTFILTTNHNSVKTTPLIEGYTTNDILEVYSEYNNSFSDLPTLGELCKADSFYNYNDSVVFCIQTHNRTIYEPRETPALFRFYREDTGELKWMSDERVNVDDIRVYLGISYSCFQLHTTETGREPTNTLGVLWTKVATDSLWHEGIEYTVTVDTVWHSDIQYACTQSHVSQIGWEPPNVPALWDEILISTSGCDDAIEWNASDHWTTYTIGDLRTNDNKLWKVTSVAYTYYEPSGANGHFSWEYVEDCN